jgi:hypothetical protein
MLGQPEVAPNSTIHKDGIRTQVLVQGFGVGDDRSIRADTTLSYHRLNPTHISGYVLLVTGIFLAGGDKKSSDLSVDIIS